MTTGPWLIVILVLAILFIVVSITKFKLHPFIALLLTCYGIGLAAQMPLLDIGKTITGGFGSILSSIGIVIILGTIIGVILEKSGAAVTMADTVLKIVGPKRPTVAMSVIGYIVSIPVFCDSGFVILSALKKSLVKKSGASAVAMSIALGTGLYATHTFVPPTPGPIAAAGNLGLGDKLGLVILLGLGVAAVATAVGLAWATFIGKRCKSEEDNEPFVLDHEVVSETFARLPGVAASFLPIFAPIFLIALGSIAMLPGKPLGSGVLFSFVAFLGQPVNALTVGLLIACSLLPKFDKETLTDWVEQGLKGAATIIMITGAGGALGAMLKTTQIGDYLGQSLSGMKLGILLPFIVAAALKTAQGSSTVSLVTTSSLMAPLLVTLGLDSTTGQLLTVMAIGAGAMTVSHANDSYFWVVSQFSGMDVATAYKAHTMATLCQGVASIILVFVLSLFLL